jgi:hypothetical protein
MQTFALNFVQHFNTMKNSPKKRKEIPLDEPIPEFPSQGEESAMDYPPEFPEYPWPEENPIDPSEPEIDPEYPPEDTIFNLLERKSYL